jgi:redox-sensitive bicupin YhaK (pirin superfamily)
MSIINLVIKAKAKDIGDNFIVRRSLPHHKKKMIGPFIFWDHMGPVNITSKNPMKVRAHPHIGLSTLTYLFQGHIIHRDSLQNIQKIIPGEVNWMTAGEGITHSERAGYDGVNQTLEGIQIWIALPKKSEKVEPNFFHIKEKELPIIENSDYQLTLIAGAMFGKKSPVPVYSDLFYSKIELDKDKEFNYQLDNKNEAALYLTKGSVEIEGQTYNENQLICFHENVLINIKANEESEFMFFGGEIFPEKRFIWWNFVASDNNLIEEAKLRWRDNKFESVIDEDEYIPLPD